MVAERGVELDAAVEQRLVGHLELLDEVLRPLGAVDVVADREHQLERKRVRVFAITFAELVLLALPLPKSPITRSSASLLVRQGDRLPRRGRRRLDR